MGAELLQLANFNQRTPIRIVGSDGAIEMTVESVLQWIAPGAPPHEAFKFLLTAKAFGLNPLANEVYLANMGDRWATIVAKAGYLKAAQRHPEFMGYKAGVVGAKEVPMLGPDGRPLPGGAKDVELRRFEGTIILPPWKLVGGWAEVRRRGQEPTLIEVSLDEYYNDKSSAWRKYMREMIRKVALVHAIRETFAISDAYDEAELDAEPVKARMATQREQATLADHSTGNGFAALPQPEPLPATAPEVIDVAVQDGPETAERFDPATAPGVAETLAHVLNDPTNPPPQPEPDKALGGLDFTTPITAETSRRLSELVIAAELTIDEQEDMLRRRGVRTGHLNDLGELNAREIIRKLEVMMEDQFPFEGGADGAAETTPVETPSAEIAEPTAESAADPTVDSAPDSTADPTTNFTMSNMRRREPKSPKGGKGKREAAAKS